MLIESKWPFKDRSKVQLFSMNTPNGIKIAVALEELNLPYEPHLVDIRKNDQFDPAFVSISPNSKIPALVDPTSPGPPIVLAESGAMLIYLAEKAGALIPTDPQDRLFCLQWLFFQVSHIGPMFGQFGHFFKFARDKCRDPYPLERYTAEARRLVGVLDQRLQDREFLADGYSIADIATFPWVNGVIDFYQAGEVLGITEAANVRGWLERCNARPASQRGKSVNAPG